MASTSSKEMEWPRDFRLVPSTSPRARFWSHEMYRGKHNEPVRILYSRTKMQSEEIAQEFLQESVVGFDMEWPWQNADQATVPLQQRIGLIQIASEDKIALFHIGLHAGQTAKDVLAPSLRQIIESNDIRKTGVGVLNADFSRLRRWFGLKPRGALELSHFHNLVTYGSWQPGKVTTKMKALSKLVDEHLGLPLYKGKVRTSNWSRPLNKAQILYAAADAYAGVMLYHCMNAKRLAMDPVPPLPINAEIYLPMRSGMGSIISLRLESSSENTNGISAVEFYEKSTAEQSLRGEVDSHLADSAEKDVEGEGEEEQEEEILAGTDSRPPGDHVMSTAPSLRPTDSKRQLASRNEGGLDLVLVGRRGKHMILEQRDNGATVKVPEPRRTDQPPPRHISATVCKTSRYHETSYEVSRHKPNDSESTKVLFQRLSAHRKRIAEERKCLPFVVAHNTLLSAISEKRPQNEQELRQIKGIGKVKAEMYGPAWLAIVRDFLEEPVVAAVSDKQKTDLQPSLPTTPNPRRTQTCITTNASTDGHRKTPTVLHTGISFKMENATLEAADPTTFEIHDDSSAFGSPLRSPSPSTLKRKRELLDSSSKSQVKQRPGLPQPALHSRRPVANATRQPDLQTSTTSTQPARDVPVSFSPQKEVSSTLRTYPQNAAPKQLFSPHEAARGVDPTMARTQGSMKAQIFRNKLLAFNRRVTSTFVLSEDTIEHIVRKPPKTAQEMLRIPNILPFANACARQNQCLLTFILKSTQ
ncbi:hypothetical protein N0V82_004153 [Gnomoniopsis sp. IMI 355080]|nr:hypothetical protein N0V82_004153 [Gnomoniopsis sp. IMI 355080]